MKSFCLTQGGKKLSKRLIRYLLHLSQVRIARIQPGYDTILSASGPNMNIRNNESILLKGSQDSLGKNAYSVIDHLLTFLPNDTQGDEK